MRRVRTSAVAVLSAALSSLLFTGCFTGKRPILAAEPVEISDPAVAAVVERLEIDNTSQYTAAYSIVTKLASEALPPTNATVAQTGATNLSITIGNIRFLDQDIGPQTCNLATVSCVPSLDDAQVSNLLVNHDFYAVSPAARLRQDSATMVGAALGSTRMIAGQTATCVEVDFAAGSKVYCALDSGLLAFQDTPDLQIDLLSVTADADQALFTTSTVGSG